MKTQIQNRLAELERERGIRILYACESGSRAWDFASPDSDYDVRFIYAHTPAWYLSIHNRDETIELPLEGELDLSGWDLRKALRLFAKSNGAMIEWLHSPIVYRQDKEVVTMWRALVQDIVSPKALAAHYIGQCKRIWLGSLQADQVRTKHYVYVLRTLLAAKWVIERRSVAPIEFAKLVNSSGLPESLTDSIGRLLEQKTAGDEQQSIGQDRVLHPYIDLQLEALEAVLRQMVGFVPDTDLVDSFLHSILEQEIVTPAQATFH